MVLLQKCQEIKTYPCKALAWEISRSEKPLSFFSRHNLLFLLLLVFIVIVASLSATIIIWFTWFFEMVCLSSAARQKGYCVCVCLVICWPISLFCFWGPSSRCVMCFYHIYWAFVFSPPTARGGGWGYASTTASASFLSVFNGRSLSNDNDTHTQNILQFYICGY